MCSSTPTQFIEAAMVGDSTQPAPQAATTLKSLNPLECLEEYLLAYILGSFAVAENTNRKRGDRGTVCDHEDLKRVFTPPPRDARQRRLLCRAIDAFVPRLRRRRTVVLGCLGTDRGTVFHASSVGG